MVLKGFEGTFKGNVKEFKKVLDCFAPEATVIINDSVDIICRNSSKNYGPFGVTILPTSSFSKDCKDPNELFAIGEVLNDPPKDNAYICVRKSLEETCTKEEIDTYGKATVGELIDELKTIPAECKIMYDNLIIENTNGVLDNRFNVPLRRANLEYYPYKIDKRWGFAFHAIGED